MIINVNESAQSHVASRLVTTYLTPFKPLLSPRMAHDISTKFWEPGRSCPRCCLNSSDI